MEILDLNLVTEQTKNFALANAERKILHGHPLAEHFPNVVELDHWMTTRIFRGLWMIHQNPLIGRIWPDSNCRWTSVSNGASSTFVCAELLP